MSVHGGCFEETHGALLPMCTQFVHNFLKKILIMEYTLFGLSSCVFEAGVRQTLRDLKQDTIFF